jgi:microcystin degradation protein MlrC
MKIFTACIGTETHTFAPLPTDQNSYESCYFVRGGAHPEQVNMFGQPLIVWTHNAEKRGWKVSESLCTFAMPSGITLRKTYEALRDEVIADLEAAMPVNAVMLSLHGAMPACPLLITDNSLLRNH